MDAGMAATVDMGRDSAARMPPGDSMVVTDGGYVDRLLSSDLDLGESDQGLTNTLGTKAGGGASGGCMAAEHDGLSGLMSFLALALIASRRRPVGNASPSMASATRSLLIKSLRK